jgi:type VI secretion system Hcp family effector
MKRYNRHLATTAVLLVGLFIGSLARVHNPDVASAANSMAAQPAALGRMSIDGVVTNLAIRGYQWSVEQPALAAAGGSAGKATFRSVEVTTDLNSASAPLFLATAKATPYATATVTIFAPGTTNTLMSYQLSNVLIAGVSDGADATANNKPLETVALSYEQITVTYNASTGPISGGWDITQNTQLP